MTEIRIEHEGLNLKGETTDISLIGKQSRFTVNYQFGYAGMPSRDDGQSVGAGKLDSLNADSRLSRRGEIGQLHTGP